MDRMAIPALQIRAFSILLKANYIEIKDGGLNIVRLIVHREKRIMVNGYLSETCGRNGVAQVKDSEYQRIRPFRLLHV